MKHLFTLLVIVALSLDSQGVFASELAQKSTGDQAALQAQFDEMNLSASEFSALTPKEIAKKTDKKMSWGEKILFKIAQKRIKKQLQPSSSEGKTEGSSKNGKISVILGGVGLLVTLVTFSSEVFSILFLLGLVCGIVGLIFGIIGLKKDENNTAAIIGTVLGPIVLLLLFVSAAIIISEG